MTKYLCKIINVFIVNFILIFRYIRITYSGLPDLGGVSLLHDSMAEIYSL